MQSFFDRQTLCEVLGMAVDSLRWKPDYCWLPFLKAFKVSCQIWILKVDWKGLVDAMGVKVIALSEKCYDVIFIGNNPGSCVSFDVLHRRG